MEMSPDEEVYFQYLLDIGGFDWIGFEDVFNTSLCSIKAKLLFDMLVAVHEYNIPKENKPPYATL